MMAYFSSLLWLGCINWGLHKVTYILVFRNDPDEFVLHNLLVWLSAGVLSKGAGSLLA